MAARIVFCRFSGPAADCLLVSGFSQLFDVADSVEEAACETASEARGQALRTACTRAAPRVNYMAG